MLGQVGFFQGEMLSYMLIVPVQLQKLLINVSPGFSLDACHISNLLKMIY